MEEFNWELFEQDQSDFDQQMERSAFENTFLILTGKATYESLLDNQSEEPDAIEDYTNTAVLFNPASKEYNPKFPHLNNTKGKEDLIDAMIEYYTETEEYEKCAKLVKLKNK
jgi:hypothetical protein